MVDEDFRKLPAEKLLDLSPEVLKLLDELRPEEVDALRAFARLGPERVKQILETVEFAASIQTVGRFTKRLIVLIVGLFVGTIMLAKQISEAWTWVKSQM